MAERIQAFSNQSLDAQKNANFQHFTRSKSAASATRDNPFVRRDAEQNTISGSYGETNAIAGRNTRLPQQTTSVVTHIISPVTPLSVPVDVLMPQPTKRWTRPKYAETIVAKALSCPRHGRKLQAKPNKSDDPNLIHEMSSGYSSTTAAKLRQQVDVGSP